MKIILGNAHSERNREVECSIGDRVEVTEWDGYVAIGTVKELTVSKIVIDHAKFLEGVHSSSQVDYSELENQTEFSFNLEDLYELKVAEFAPLSPLDLVQGALRENYCGSTEIVMSSHFFQMYRRHMQEKCDRYYQYPIRVDESLKGFCVYAVPNQKTLDYQSNPPVISEYCGRVSFYSHGQFVGSNEVTYFASSDLEEVLREKTIEFKRFLFEKFNLQYEKLAYKLPSEDGTCRSLRGVA